MSTDTLARRLADFERRLKALERGTRLDRAAVVVDGAGTSLDVRQALADSTTASYNLALAVLVVVTPADQLLVTVPVRFSDAPSAAELDSEAGFEGDVLYLRAEQTIWHRRSGVWVLGSALDQAQAPAFAAADTAVTTADGLILTTWQATEPGAGNYGDLWFKTDTANAPYRWTDAAGWQSLSVNSAQSTNYVPAEAGWAITPDGDSQFNDVQALGQLSASVVAADSVMLGGSDLAGVLASSSIGKLLSARLPQQGANLAISATNTKLFELNCGTVRGGRTYRVSTSMLLDGTAPLALTDRIAFLYRYTIDGSTPTISSPTMDGGFNQGYVQFGDFTFFKPEAEIDIASEVQLRVALCGQVIGGSGTYAIYATASAAARPVMSLYDDGPAGTRNDAAISLTGGGLTRFNKVFNALWAWGADGAGNLLNDSYGYIGNDPYGEGGQMLFVGFDSASMVSQLAGMTTPVSCYLRWKPRTRATSTGLDVRILTHNFATRAAATSYWGFPLMDPQYSPSLTSRGTFGNAAPGSSYDFSLGTAVLSAVKAATIKGVAFVNSSTTTADYGVPQADGTGSIYGNGTSECQLVVAYDGTS